jgi:hypothetical protein
MFEHVAVDPAYGAADLAFAMQATPNFVAARIELEVREDLLVARATITHGELRDTEPRACHRARRLVRRREECQT